MDDGELREQAMHDQRKRELREAYERGVRDAAAAIEAERDLPMPVTPSWAARVVRALLSPPATDGGAKATRMFPIHSEDRRQLKTPPYAIEWAFIAEHEEQAKANHGQTIERLAERGGCGWNELLAIVRDQHWRVFSAMPMSEARDAVLADFEKWRTTAKVYLGNEQLLEEYPAALWPDGPSGGPYLPHEREKQKAHALAADAQRKRLGLPPFAWEYGRTGRS